MSNLKVINQPYFTEVVFNNTGQGFGKTRYLSAVVAASNKEEAKSKVLDHYRPIYTAGEKGQFYVQCCWIANKPTIKAVKEVANELYKGAEAQINVGGFGDDRKMHSFGYFKTKEEVIESWNILNIDWGDVYYSRDHQGYVVEMHPYMGLPCIVKVFKGKTNDKYEEALKWVSDNTMKKDKYRYKLNEVN